MTETGFGYIVSLIGERAALRLMEAWGGIRLHVPEHITPGHILSRRIGFDAARKLAEAFGGTQIPVPRGAHAIRERRNEEIRRRYAAGESAAKIAREFKMTERWVYQIVGEKPKRSLQHTLFDGL